MWPYNRVNLTTDKQIKNSIFGAEQVLNLKLFISSKLKYTRNNINVYAIVL